ncbi:fibronectin type III domain-containing protein [Streptomyces sp. NPDC088747]|uniref:fibronectin type III domain-containing protein n=1 Tax=Streptomyces sp. NPDC088747 TaxID=3365886 RepID=UPI0037FECADA
MRIPVHVAVPAVLLLALSACSVPQRAGDEPGLRASLTTPTDIDLSWREEEPQPAGHGLEFATEESGPWTVLQYLPAGVRTYRHPDLMPHTTFFYRLRAFDGPVSAPLTVALPQGGMTKADEDSSHTWLPARKDPGRVVPGRPLAGSGAGAPTGFKAVVKHANGILFTWTDHASDEAGFLLEARTRGGSEYEPLVVLDPDVNSTGLITLPTEKEASYRVRAFRHGELSNVVRLTTGE